jgi:hypothetical protein
VSLAENRRRLAAEQGRLLRALAGEGPAPAGFDPSRLRASAAALRRKRARAAARAWPGLARALGEEFETRFTDFAARTPLPREGGPLADGRAFAAELAARGELPDEGRLEALAVDLHHRKTAGGLRPRRGFAFKAARLRAARRLLLGVRLPWLGVWQFRLPW